MFRLFGQDMIIILLLLMKATRSATYIVFSVGLSTLTKLILYVQKNVIELQSDIDRIGCWVQSLI